MNGRDFLTIDANSLLQGLRSLFKAEKADKLLSPYPNNYVVQVTITPTLLRQAGYGEPLEDEFLQVASVQDDFYKSLISEINRCFAYGLPFLLSMLIRKLIENLIIDILRKKYGTTEIGLYFNPAKARFLDFSVLQKNLADKRADFAYITTNLDSSLSAISIVTVKQEMQRLTPSTHSQQSTR